MIQVSAERPYLTLKHERPTRCAERSNSLKCSRGGKPISGLGREQKKAPLGRGFFITTLSLRFN